MASLTTGYLLATGGSQEVTLTFAPDHASDYFSDGVHVELFNMEEAYSFQVIGQAKEHIMYVTGGELMKPNVESLLPMVTIEPDEGECTLCYPICYHRTR